MFNIKPPSVPGFRVGQAEDQLGFAINDDGSTRSAPTAGSAVPGLGGYFSGDALQAATDVGDIQPAASANDPQGLKMANDAAREAGLDTPELRQKFHRATTGQGITSYQEPLSIARQIKAGAY